MESICASSNCQDDCLCSTKACKIQLDACVADQSCKKMQDCVSACPCGGDASCVMACAIASASANALPMAECQTTHCHTKRFTQEELQFNFGSIANGNSSEYVDIEEYIPRASSHLIGALANVPTKEDMDKHRGQMANESITKNHMSQFNEDSLIQYLDRELGISMSVRELRRCAPDPSCLATWSTSPELSGKSIIITDIVGSFEMTHGGMSCHATSDYSDIRCHGQGDTLITPGKAFYAMGKALEHPGGLVEDAAVEFPVALRCHKYVAKSASTPCHLLSNSELLIAPAAGLDQVPSTSDGHKTLMVSKNDKAEDDFVVDFTGHTLKLGGYYTHKPKC